MKLLRDAVNRPVTTAQLNLKNTLMNGQAFNWEPLNDQQTKFQGIFRHYYIVIQSNSAEQIEYEEYPKSASIAEDLQKYF